MSDLNKIIDCICSSYSMQKYNDQEIDSAIKFCKTQLKENKYLCDTDIIFFALNKIMFDREFINRKSNNSAYPKHGNHLNENA